MSTSRRSRTTSARSIPVRRPLLSISKASAGPSVSLVFAESEPRKRKVSASASLKGMWGKEKEKETKVESSSNENGKIVQDPPLEGTAINDPEPQPEAALEPPQQEPSAPVDAEPAFLEPIVAAVEPASPPEGSSEEQTPKPPPQRLDEASTSPEASSVAFPSTSPPSRSWFGSLGRARGRDKARVYVESTLKESTTIQVDPIPEQQQSAEPITADALSESPTSDTITPNTPQPTPSVPQPIPTHSRNPSQTTVSVPSSVDEDVPPLPATPPSDSHIPQRRRVTSSPSSNLNSLNPSTSRFTLSIPLLGRAKVPLDEVMPKSAPASVAEVPAAPIATSGDQAKEEHVEVKEQNEDDRMPSGHVQSVSTSSTTSWWSYVGWGPAEEQPGTIQHSQSTTEDEAGEVKPPPEPESEPQSVPEAITIPRERTMSVLSSETTSRASWFAPWSWYPSPTTASVDETAQDTPPHPPTDGMTPSERIREEALARPDPTIEEMQATASNAIIESTMANRSGWTSFFMSVNRKAIESGTDVKRDENGNEIMDIDEDSDSASVSSKQPPSPQKSSLPTSQKVEPRPEPKKLPAPQLIISEDVKKEASSKRKVSAPPPPKPPASPKPSIASKKEKKDKQPAPPPPPPVPNYVLPTWEDIFHTPPRAQPPPLPTSSRLLRFITGKGKSREDDLPCMLLGDEAGWAKSCKRVVVLGIHGWFPGAIMRTMFGEPTGTSPKFVSMMEQALENFQTRHGFRFEKVTGMPLEGEGTIGGRVEKLYNALMGNESWVSDLHDADAILVATHSQGSVVSTHLLNRLIEEGHIVTALSARVMPDELIGVRRVQRVCCLALCGIHLGPLRYLSSSSLLQPYFQYLETQAARELFEFQNTNSEVSKAYVSALRNVVHHGTKMVYIASLNDQVVPIYSGLFTSASHPLILRALYMDGDAYHSSDFLSNLLVLLIRILNSDLSDSGLVSLLSEATAGSLNGVGHSTAYEEIGTYSLAVDYLFRTTPGPLGAPLHMEDFDAAQEQNDYEIPWALRDLIADERVRHLVGPEIGVLRGMFGNWKPRTAILRDVKKKLGPIQRLGNIEGRRSPSKL